MTRLPLLDDLEVLFRKESATRHLPGGAGSDGSWPPSGGWIAVINFADGSIRLHSTGIGRGFLVGFDERDQLTFCCSKLILEIQLIPTIAMRQSAIIRDLVSHRTRLSKLLRRLAGATFEVHTALGVSKGQIVETRRGLVMLATSNGTLFIPLSSIMRATVVA